MFGSTKICKIKDCKNPIWGEGLCKNHKPRKEMSKGMSKMSKTSKKMSKHPEQTHFFVRIWGSRPHFSEVSGQFLGKEPLSVFFHHILSKEKYPQAALDEENIILLTLQEHDQVEMDMYRYDEVNKRRENLLIKYNLK